MIAIITVADGASPAPRGRGAGLPAARRCSASGTNTISGNKFTATWWSSVLCSMLATSAAWMTATATAGDRAGGRDRGHAARHDQARDRQRAGRAGVAEVVARQRHDEPLAHQHRRLPDQQQRRDNAAAPPASAAAARRPRRPRTASSVNAAAASSKSPFVCRNSRTTPATSDQRVVGEPCGPRGGRAPARAETAAASSRGVAAEGVVVQSDVFSRSRVLSLLLSFSAVVAVYLTLARRGVRGPALATAVIVWAPSSRRAQYVAIESQRLQQLRRVPGSFLLFLRAQARRFTGTGRLADHAARRYRRGDLVLLFLQTKGLILLARRRRFSPCSRSAAGVARAAAAALVGAAGAAVAPLLLVWKPSVLAREWFIVPLAGDYLGHTGDVLGAGDRLPGRDRRHGRGRDSACAIACCSRSRSHRRRWSPACSTTRSPTTSR